MNLKGILWVVIALVILGLLAWPKLTAPPKSDAIKGGGKGAPIKVSVFAATSRSSGESIDVSGTILPMEEIELHAEIQGRIVKIGFTEGQDVAKGQLLVKINDADLKAQLNKALAMQHLKKETESRNKQLLAKGAISQEAYDQVSSEVQAVNADVDLIKEQIRKTEIIAPFSGQIGLRYISEGGYVTNATKIAALHTINQVKIEFSIPEKYATRVRKGTQITFTTEGSDELNKATVYAIEPQVDAATRNVMMRALCDNKNRKIIPGAFAKVKVDLGANKDVLMIPTQAVVPILKGKKVFVVEGDSAIERVIVTGTRGDELIEVKEGLKPGDKVIVKGVMYIRQGSRVIVTP